VLLYYLVSIA